MPTWLVHGFRWPRPLIRIHVILQNLDDAAPEWLMAPGSTNSLIENFHSLYPDIMKNLPSLRFVEQFDPEDVTNKSQPYAYVCDQVHEVKLAVDIEEVRGKGVDTETWAALCELRDQLAPGEKMAWFIVVNGDVERYVPPADGLLDGVYINASQASQTSTGSMGDGVIFEEDEESQTRRGNAEESKRISKGPKSWLKIGSKVKRSKSSKDLRETAIRTVPAMPQPNQRVSVPSSASRNNGKAPVRSAA